jgi:thiamine biosynthesis lipoprotein
MATSGAYGTRFEPGLGQHHLFDPASGKSAAYCASVTVIADHATTADALSTALFLTPPDERERLLRRAGPARAHVVEATGDIVEIS